MSRITARVAILGFLGLALLGGCGSERVGDGGPQIQPRPRLPWQAAIGDVRTNAPNIHCSGVLVAPDTIATAAHCLYMETSKRASSPNDIVFRPNRGSLPILPPSRGVAIRAFGGPIRGGHLRLEDVPKDWMLVKISPPVTMVQPIAIANLKTGGMLKLIEAENRLLVAGYGNGGYDQLKVNDKCRLMSAKEINSRADDSRLQLDCALRIGDSGGAIILLDGAGQPALIGIVNGIGDYKTKPLGFGANASQFLPHLRPLISSLPIPPVRPANLALN